MKTKKLLAVIITLALLAGLFAMTTMTPASGVAGILYPVAGTMGGDAIAPGADVKAMFGQLGVCGVYKTKNSDNDWAAFGPTANSIVASATGLEFYAYIPATSVGDKVTIVYGINGGSSTDWANGWYYKDVTVAKGGAPKKVSVPYTDIKNNYGGGTAITATQVATAGLSLRVNSASTGILEGYFSDVYDIANLPPIETNTTTTDPNATTIPGTTVEAKVLVPVANTYGDHAAAPSAGVKAMFDTLDAWGVINNGSYAMFRPTPNAANVVSATGYELYVYIPTNSIGTKMTFALCPAGVDNWFYCDVNVPKKGELFKVSVGFAFIKDNFGAGRGITAAEASTATTELRINSSETSGNFEGYFSDVYDIGKLPAVISQTVIPTETTTAPPNTTTPTDTTTNDTETTTDETTTAIIIKGDVNGDGKVNGMDLLLMKQHILEIPGKKIEEGTPAFFAADTNEDGKINGMDMLYLKKKIIG